MIQLPETAPGFDDPLGLLAACHGRIQAQCELLLRLQAHLGQFGSDIQASQAARGSGSISPPPGGITMRMKSRISSPCWPRMPAHSSAPRY